MDEDLVKDTVVKEEGSALPSSPPRFVIPLEEFKDLHSKLRTTPKGHPSKAHNNCARLVVAALQYTFDRHVRGKVHEEALAALDLSNIQKATSMKVSCVRMICTLSCVVLCCVALHCPLT